MSACRPLYLCPECEEEFPTVKLFDTHACTGVEVEVDPQWYEDLKNAVYKCPSETCGNVFKTFEGLIPHLKVLKGCCIVPFYSREHSFDYPPILTMN